MSSVAAGKLFHLEGVEDRGVEVVVLGPGGGVVHELTGVLEQLVDVGGRDG